MTTHKKDRLDDLHKHIAFYLEDKKVISSFKELPDKGMIKMVGRHMRDRGNMNAL